MRRITFDLLYCWFVTSLIYYGLGKSLFTRGRFRRYDKVVRLPILINRSGLNAGSLAGDVFSNNALMGFFEIIAHCVAPLIMDMKYLGRRGALSLMFFIGGISCLGSLLFKNLSRCATDEVTLCDEVSQVNSLLIGWFFHWSKNFSTLYAIRFFCKSLDGLLLLASLVSQLVLQ